MSTSFDFPTEEIELPSKGLLYPDSNPLSSGKVIMKYMTAKEEDILTNGSYIQKGIVLDKLLKSLIVSKINYNDLVIGDKNAIMVAARILGYGNEYSFTYNGVEHTIDLSKCENKPFEHNNKGVNEFEFIVPSNGTKIVYKILTHGDEQKIQADLEGFKKIDKDSSNEISTRLKYMIVEVGGERDKSKIREYIDKHFLARDARAFRQHVKDTQPDVDLTFFPDGNTTRVNIPIGIRFFYPDF